MDTGKYGLFAKEYGLWIGMIVVGVGLMVGGAVVAANQGKVEIQGVDGETGEASRAAELESVYLVVDVAGAVVFPGVYKLSEGARVEDALMAAGGLGEKADRTFVERYINRADRVRDGMKIYVPEEGLDVGREVMSGETGVSINQGSQQELESLWGVGAARAKIIMENRPYGAIEELVSKAGLPQSIIDKNKEKLRL